MARFGDRQLPIKMIAGLLSLTLMGCGPRVTITTGTTIGLKATPGDGATRPPQVTFGYKRAETSLVPTAGRKATSNTDAFSTLASIYFRTTWFGKTELRSFISTGNAARDIQGTSEDNEQPATRDIQPAEPRAKSQFWDQFSDETRGK